MKRKNHWEPLLIFGCLLRFSGQQRGSLFSSEYLIRWKLRLLTFDLRTLLLLFRFYFTLFYSKSIQMSHCSCACICDIGCIYFFMSRKGSSRKTWQKHAFSIDFEVPLLYISIHIFYPFCLPKPKEQTWGYYNTWDNYNICLSFVLFIFFDWRLLWKKSCPVLLDWT